MMKSEEDILKILKSLSQRSDVIVGPGDDCAVIETGSEKLQLLAVDQLVSGIHYLKEKTSPGEIARKLLNRNLSDIAAMGGIPAQALLTITADLSDQSDWDTWFQEFFTSLNDEAGKWDVCICGGDISSFKSENSVLTLTITGWVEQEKLCLRSNAEPGEILFCTGSFGNSFLSEHHLNFIPRIREARFLSGDFTRTIIDVSDGLLKDLRRIAVASGVGITLEIAKIPLCHGASINQALSEGEDYELLFSVPSESVDRLVNEWPFTETVLTRIGTFTSEHIGEIFDLQGSDLVKALNAGFDHFNQSTGVGL